MSYRKSTTCKGRVSGKPVTEYNTEFEAQQGAEYAEMSYGSKLAPYRCRRCHMWHLAPAERQTPCKACHRCTGSNGRAKLAYQTERDAERRAQILRKEKGVHLRVYECESGSGWHLTSRP